MVTVHCFFSGGRDSAVACAVAKKVADVRGWDFRLVHVDTTIGLEETEKYVREYARWLGAELVVLRPDLTFEEFVARYPYWPHVYPPWARWCYHKLKRIPTERYIKRFYRQGDIIVLGIRGPESLFRISNYTATFAVKYYSDAKVNAKIWLPLLRVDDDMVDKLIKELKIPESPVWRKIGSSGECFCLAGSSEKAVIRAVHAYPELAVRLMRIDDIIHANRRKGESYPIFLKNKKERLKVWLQRAMNEQGLANYLDNKKYVGKSCQGSCML
jgi:3'-phosphoadenosine 5'-phosphosulfate sulfotransferase (PAPS reductase)/FAD synthetase